MINLKCEGHTAEYELTNVINLFSSYITESYELESLYKKNEAIARLLRNNELIEEAKYEVDECEEELQHKKRVKQALKKAVYDVCVSLTGKKMPWGILTGIRPTKIVHDCFNLGMSEASIFNHLQEEYFVSKDKAYMMIAVAKEEKAILEKNDPNEISIYIGIPFCPTRCVYCSFTAFPLDQKAHLVEAYLEALFKEIDFVAEAKRNVPIRSLYIGGGTPTSLNEDQLERLLKHIRERFDLSQIEEYTIEAGRPDTITEEKLRIMKVEGVGRISINPQSMSQKTLDAIGRRHSVEDIKEVYYAARALGHDNINMDMIVGLPDETVEDVEHTLVELAKLAPDNITVHTMAIKRASKLREALREEEYVGLSPAIMIEAMLERCEAHMKEMGLKPYYLYRQKNMLGNFENVGYAAPGKECIYNIEIMEEKESIIALGAGAITKIVYECGTRIDRIPNVKNLEDYINRIDEMIERKREGFIKYQ